MSLLSHENIIAEIFMERRRISSTSKTQITHHMCTWVTRRALNATRGLLSLTSVVLSLTRGVLGCASPSVRALTIPTQGECVRPTVAEPAIVRC